MTYSITLELLLIVELSSSFYFRVIRVEFYIWTGLLSLNTSRVIHLTTNCSSVSMLKYVKVCLSIFFKSRKVIYSTNFDAFKCNYSKRFHLFCDDKIIFLRVGRSRSTDRVTSSIERWNLGYLDLSLWISCSRYCCDNHNYKISLYSHRY